mgnify:CR=1 FL=1
MKLAENIQRLGTESAFKILAEAKKLELEGKKIIHLGLGQPDFKSPKHVIDATKKALDDGHHGYVLPNGIIECRQAVTRKIKKLYNADLVFFDGTLWTDDEMIKENVGIKTGQRMGHISMSGKEGSMEAFEKLNVKRKIYIHINTTNPVLVENSDEKDIVVKQGWEVAYDKMEVVL